MSKVLHIDKPNAKQELFLRSKKRFIGYGGARGGGKSWAIRTKAILLALNYPGITIKIIRKTFKDLQDNHITTLRKQLAGFATYNVQLATFTFSNGSTILMRHCEHERDLQKIQGQESDIIFIEECTQFTWEQIVFILSSNRGTGPFPRRSYFTGNPGGVGHNWFKRLFVKGEYLPNEKPEEYEFIPATVDDNTSLMEADPEYVSLLEMLPEKLRQAHRFGNWDIFTGQFFEEFRDIPEQYKDKEGTHVIAPFEIPQEWKIYRSFDWGYSKPFACQWWAIDYDGRAYNILELYGCTNEPDTGVKWIPDKLFAEIRKIELEHRWLKGKHIYGIADPAIWDAQTGESIADTAEKYRVYFEKADNSRITGWMQFHYRLDFDENGIPMCYIFNTCKGFIRTIPIQMFDTSKLEDLDTSLEDHLCDSARYFFMSQPIKPRKIIPTKVIPYNPLDTDEKYDKYAFYRT